MYSYKKIKILILSMLLPSLHGMQPPAGNRLVNINAQDQYGDTALHRAVRGNRVSEVLELLQSPVIDVNLQDKEGFAPLHMAAYSNQVRVIQELFKKPTINVNIRTKGGLTPLHQAVFNNKIEAVLELLKASKIDINALSNEGYAPLHMAVHSESIDLVRVLLRVPDIILNQRSLIQGTPLDMAVYIPGKAIYNEIKLAQLRQFENNEIQRRLAILKVYRDEAGELKSKFLAKNAEIEARKVAQERRDAEARIAQERQLLEQTLITEQRVIFRTAEQAARKNVALTEGFDRNELLQKLLLESEKLNRDVISVVVTSSYDALMTHELLDRQIALEESFVGLEVKEVDCRQRIAIDEARELRQPAREFEQKHRVWLEAVRQQSELSMLEEQTRQNLVADGVLRLTNTKKRELCFREEGCRNEFMFSETSSFQQLMQEFEEQRRILVAILEEKKREADRVQAESDLLLPIDFDDEIDLINQQLHYMDFNIAEQQRQLTIIERRQEAMLNDDDDDDSQSNLVTQPERPISQSIAEQGQFSFQQEQLAAQKQQLDRLQKEVEELRMYRQQQDDPFYMAIFQQDMYRINDLIKQDHLLLKKVFRHQGKDCTPLMLAVFLGNINMVRLFVRAGSIVGVPGSLRSPSYEYAISLYHKAATEEERIQRATISRFLQEIVIRPYR